MDVEERVDRVEGEMTLIKGEIKQALIELRDMVTKPRSLLPEPERDAVVHQVQNLGGQQSQQPPPQPVQQQPPPQYPPYYPQPPPQPFQQQPPPQPFQQQPPPQPFQQQPTPQPTAQLVQEKPPAPVVEEPPAKKTAQRAPAAAKSSIQDAVEANSLALDETVADRQPGLGRRGQPLPEESLEGDEGDGQPGPDEDHLSSLESPGPDGSGIPSISGQRAIEVHALDIHSVANLMRWVGTVRPRIGEEQLGRLLDVYEETGYLPDSIEELVLQLAKLKAIPGKLDGQGFNLEEFIDTLLQLHAIVSGLEYRRRGHRQELAQGDSWDNGSGQASGGAQELEPFTLAFSQGRRRMTFGPTGGARDRRRADGAGPGYPDRGTLDANLVANLIRWAGTVQPRIGQEQLEALLEVYKLTGNLPAAVERLLLKAAKLHAVHQESTGDGFTVQEFIDSLLKLHGIVYSTEYQPSSRGRELGRRPRVARGGDG